MLLLVCAVGCRAGGEFGCATFLTGRSRSCKPGRLARAAFPARAAAAMPATAATTSSASAPLPTLSALRAGPFARKLTLLCAPLDAGAWLIACRRRRSAHRRLCGGTRVGIAIPLASFLITVVVTASAPITAISTAITSIVAASLGATAIAVPAALTAL